MKLAPKPNSSTKQSTFSHLILASLLMVLSACSGSPNEQDSSQGDSSAKQQANNGKKNATGKAPKAGMPMPTVDVMTATLSNIPETLTLSGRVSAYQTAEVRPQITGIIQKRYFNDGSYVKKGQPLYKVDARDYQSTSRSLQAALNRHEVNLKAQKIKLARYAKLLKVGAVSQQEYDDIKAQVDLARADIASAKANLKNTNLSLNRTIIRAPISGKTERTDVDVGTLVSANQAQALVSITRLDPIYVDMSQSSSEYLALKQKQQHTGQTVANTDAQVRLLLKDGSEYGNIGSLAMADTKVDPDTGTINLRGVFQNSDQLLLPGMYVTAKITLAQFVSAILVPQAALMRNPKGGSDVYVVDNNKIVQRSVMTQGTYEGQWIVTQGLQAGDAVVVSGGMNVKPDMPVNTKPVNTMPVNTKVVASASPSATATE